MITQVRLGCAPGGNWSLAAAWPEPPSGIPDESPAEPSAGAVIKTEVAKAFLSPLRGTRTYRPCVELEIAPGAVTMANDRECIDYACECIRLAGLTDDAEIRDRLMAIGARAWMAMAGRERSDAEREGLTTTQ